VLTTSVVLNSSSFQPDAFKGRVAAQLSGVSATHVTLDTSSRAGEVTVVVRAPTDAAQRNRTLAALRRTFASPAAASSALGVSVAEITVEPTLASALMAVQPPEADGSTGASSLSAGALVAIVVAVLAIVGVVMTALVYMHKERRKAKVAAGRKVPGAGELKTTSQQQQQVSIATSSSSAHVVQAHIVHLDLDRPSTTDVPAPPAEEWDAPSTEKV